MDVARADLAGDHRVLWNADVLRFNDMDTNGHVNNAVYSVLCESGRVHYFRHRIVPHLPQGETFFALARLLIEFRAEAFYPGTIETATWLAKLGRTSMSLRQAIFSGDTLVARAEAVTVLMDAPTRRPTPFTEAMRGAIVPHERPDRQADPAA